MKQEPPAILSWTMSKIYQQVLRDQIQRLQMVLLSPEKVWWFVHKCLLIVRFYFVPFTNIRHFMQLHHYIPRLRQLLSSTTIPLPCYCPVKNHQDKHNGIICLNRLFSWNFFSQKILRSQIDLLFRTPFQTTIPLINTQIVQQAWIFYRNQHALYYFHQSSGSFRCYS